MVDSRRNSLETASPHSEREDGIIPMSPGNVPPTPLQGYGTNGAYLEERRSSQEFSARPAFDYPPTPHLDVGEYLRNLREKATMQIMTCELDMRDFIGRGYCTQLAHATSLNPRLVTNPVSAITDLKDIKRKIEEALDNLENLENLENLIGWKELNRFGTESSRIFHHYPN